MKAYPIDFVRQAIEQTLLQEHIKDTHLVGGKNQIAIKSFYEQVKTQEEVERYVETYEDLVNQANRSNLIGNGILSTSENPTITNINRGLVVPMTWQCVIRCTLKDRDIMVDTINNLITRLKGRKVDIAEFSDGTLFMVGCVGNHGGIFTPYLMSGDFIKTDTVANAKTYYNSLGIDFYHPDNNLPKYFYRENALTHYMETVDNDNQLIIADTPNVIIAPNDKTFTKYKLSLSFDSIRTDEPKTLNGEEYMWLSFSGSATLVNASMKLGNDLVALGITLGTTTTYLEPLELGSNNNVNTQINQLLSNNFKPTNHADALSPIVQYTFLLDSDIALISDWFKYARYGYIPSTLTTTSVSPNTIYNISEYWSSWGNVDKETFKTKIVEDIKIDNTESDVLTLGITMQIQGENQ